MPILSSVLPLNESDLPSEPESAESAAEQRLRARPESVLKSIEVSREVPPVSHPPVPGSTSSTSSTSSDLSTALTDKQFRILSCLLDSPPGEPIQSVAHRARTTPAVIQRTLRDPTFANLYLSEVNLYMGSRRAAITQQLTSGAENPDRKDQLAWIKEYFDRLDGIKLDVNITSSSGDTFPWHVIGIDTRRRILEELEEAAKTGKLDRALASKLLGADADNSDGSGVEIVDGEIISGD